jgi:hypothetical protein
LIVKFPIGIIVLLVLAGIFISASLPLSKLILNTDVLVIGIIFIAAAINPFC